MTTEHLELKSAGPETIRHPYPGLYIVFEGGEGGGKSTQINLLLQWFDEHKFLCIETREPGGTRRGDKLRRVLLENVDGPPAPRTEVFLFLADRSENIAYVVEPALKVGTVVISDRCFYSNITYQGAGRGLGIDAVWQINKMAIGDILPDLVIFMDVEPEEGLRRRRGFYASSTVKVDRLDGEDIAFHEDVYRAYKMLQAKDPERWFSVPPHLSPEQQRELILARVAQEMVKKGMTMLECTDGFKTQGASST